MSKLSGCHSSAHPLLAFALTLVVKDSVILFTAFNYFDLPHAAALCSLKQSLLEVTVTHCPPRAEERYIFICLLYRPELPTRCFSLQAKTETLMQILNRTRICQENPMSTLKIVVKSQKQHFFEVLPASFAAVTSS